MKAYSICKSNLRREYREITKVRAINPRKAAKRFISGHGKVQPIKNRIYHVVYQGTQKLKFKV